LFHATELSPFLVVGNYLLGANGKAIKGQHFEEGGSSVQEYLDDQQNYPISLKFGRPKLAANEKIMLASMFHS